MEKSRITRNEVIFAIEYNEFSIQELVSILILTVSKLNINTYSGMAESEIKTPDGIRKSARYGKINIGKAKLVVKGFSNTNLPF